jgi:hypothetical protein
MCSGVLPLMTRPAAAAHYVVPDAFGINCTALVRVAGAVAAASDALAQSAAARMSGELPWLVLKPRGGQTYDVDGRASMGLVGRGDAHTGTRRGLGSAIR